MVQRAFPSFLRLIFPQRITGKLALMIFLLVGILISLLGLTLTQLTQGVLKSKVKTSHEEIATRSAREISLFIQSPLDLLSMTGKFIGRTHSSAWSQETVLVEMSLQFPMFDEIVSLDTSGRKIASSNPGQALAKNFYDKNLSQTVLKRKPSLSPVYIDKDYFPEIQIAVPYDEMGKVAGVLIGRVNLRGIWNIVDGIRIGKTGRAFVVSQEGLLIAHPDKKRVMRNTNLISDEDFQKIISKRTGSIEYLGKDGEIYLASAAPVPGELPLVVVVEIQAKEAYRLLDQMHFLIWSVLSVSLLVSIAVSYFAAIRMVRPIQSLKQWSRKVALGDLDYHLEPQSLDEIGLLFLRFKRMTKRLKAAREKEFLATLGMMATTISHKLKNSIVFLKTFAQIFPERKNDPHFIERFERDFASSVDYLERVFQNLSRVTSAQDIKPENVELGRIFYSVYQTYLNIASKQKIEFHLKIIPPLPEIQGDREQLQELFVNLVQNSIQAMPRGGVLELSARHCLESDEILITVRDNGAGIAPQNLQEIFKPFFTTKHTGMGLGLAISKNIVETHGGKIFVHSEWEKGTTFTVKFSLRKRIKIAEPDFSERSKIPLISSHY